MPATLENAPRVDPFEQLRQTIDELEKNSEQGAQRGDGGNAAPAGRRPRVKKGRPMSATPQPAVQAGSNAPKYEDILSLAKQLGELEAKGNDGQVKFDIKVAEAAFLGVIDLTKDKHGKGIDDAMALSAAYTQGRNSAVIFDHKEGKHRKLGATTRLMIKFGGSPKYGVGEPMGNINTFMTIWQKLRLTAKTNGVKLNDAHNALMNMAREQLKRDTLITGDELRAFCFKPGTEPRTNAEVIRGILNTLAKLKVGKLSNCPDVDNSQEISTMINACNRRLTALAKASGDQQAA